MNEMYLKGQNFRQVIISADNIFGWTALKPDFCAHKSDLENFIEFTPAYKKTVEWKCSFNFVKKPLHNFGRTKFSADKIAEIF